MLNLCFYILLYMFILDGYRDFNRKKSINSKKSAIVYGDVYELMQFISICFISSEVYISGHFEKSPTNK